MVNSQLALLSLPEEGLDGIVDTLKALLAENEAEIIGAVQKQPDLLLLAAKGLLPEKVLSALCQPRTCTCHCIDVT